MSTPDNHKPVPRSVLIFGAAAHIGRPLAQFLQREASQIRLRLVSSSPARLAELRRDFPNADVVRANYLEPETLEKAVEGMEGIFVITPGGTPEAPAMTNLVNAIKAAGSPIHILRCLGMQPESNLRRIPPSILEPPALGLPVQHPIAKRIFDESSLPVTYLNFGATFMDNFFWMKEGLRKKRKLIWHNRLIPFIDPRDIAEVAARLFLSDNHRHIGQFHTLNNGHDLMRFEDVAKLMTDTFGEPIAYDGSKEAFLDAYAHLGPLSDLLWEFFEYERANEVVWARNDFVERTLGRKPTTLRDWLLEHRQPLFSEDAPTKATRDSMPEEEAAGGTSGGPFEGLDGTWDCTVATPMGKEPHVLVMRSTPDGGLFGDMTNMRNGITMPLQNGRRLGDRLTWTLQLQKPFKIDLKVDVTVAGRELSGHASTTMIGKAAIEGTRRGV